MKVAPVLRIEPINPDWYDVTHFILDTDNADWREKITSIIVTPPAGLVKDIIGFYGTSQPSMLVGNINYGSAGIYEYTIKATGYEDAFVSITVQ